MKNPTIFPQLICLSLFVPAMTAAAQSDPVRPANSKRVTSLIARVAQDSGNLIKFKGMLPEYNLERKSADSVAQQSADDNKRAADRLAVEPQNKKLSRQANNAARMARNASRKARLAANRLDRLHNDISKASQRLEKDQAKLGRYRAGQAEAVSQP